MTAGDQQIVKLEQELTQTRDAVKGLQTELEDSLALLVASDDARSELELAFADSNKAVENLSSHRTFLIVILVLIVAGVAYMWRRRILASRASTTTD
jgi:predicted  nucleic acid-binding Zn-ribbon protein